MATWGTLLRYDSEKNCIIFYRYGEDKPPISLKLNDKKDKIVGIKTEIDETYNKAFTFVFDILSSGLIKKELVSFFGFPKELVDEASTKAQEVLEIREMNKKKPGTKELKKELGVISPLIYKEPEIPSSIAKKPYVVVQGEAAILSKDNPHDALYTFGAGPCSIVAAVVKNEKGEVEKVALAHLDIFVSKQDMRKLLGIINFGSHQVEFSIISGQENLVLKIYEVLNEFNNVKDIKYFDVDLEGSRNDSLAITKEGKIFYGENQEWNQMASRRIDQTNRMFNTQLNITHLGEKEQKILVK
ncbi:MAG: hypothetical protein QW035_01995 [Candidatus Anstonellales archaeon]